MAARAFGGPVDRPKSIIAAMLCLTTVVAGCSDEPATPSAAATTTSPVPSVDPAQEARTAIDYFNGYLDVQLPGDTHELQVIHPPLQDFRASTVISFVAARDDVVTETCGSVNADLRNVAPVLTGYPIRDMLESANAVVNASDYQSCEKYVDGRQVTVLIPKAEGPRTYVLLYHLPYR